MSFTVEQALAIHQQADPNRSPLLDRGKLEGAVQAPFTAVFGVVRYKTAHEQAAKLLEGICRAHAFQDGNKRTAWLCCMTHLRANRVELVDIPAEEIDEFVRRMISDESIDVPQIVEWLFDRTKF